MAGKQWMKTRPGHVALAALAWTILGCVFGLPDLSAGVGWRRALLVPLAQWWSWGMIDLLRKIGVMGHTLANHDARAHLFCLESEVSGRVHRLDRCMRNILAKLFDCPLALSRGCSAHTRPR